MSSFFILLFREISGGKFQFRYSKKLIIHLGIWVLLIFDKKHVFVFGYITPLVGLVEYNACRYLHNNPSHFLEFFLDKKM